MKRSAFLRTVLAATLAGFIDVRNLLPVSDEEAFGTSIMEQMNDAWSFQHNYHELFDIPQAKMHISTVEMRG